MKPFRILWRLLRLTALIAHGFYLLLILDKQRMPDGRKMPHPQAVSDWMNKLLSILNIRVMADGHVPHNKALLVANHVSWVDIPAIASACHASFLSKEEISRWPLIGTLANAAGTLYIKRGSGDTQQVAEAIGKRLDGDRQLAIFPEGTTTDGTRVEKFFPRLFAAAIDTDTPVIPVTIYYSVGGQQDFVAPYTDNQTFVGNLFSLLGRPGSEVHIVFGSPIQPSGMDRRSLAETARQSIDSRLQEFRSSRSQ